MTGTAKSPVISVYTVAIERKEKRKQKGTERKIVLGSGDGSSGTLLALDTLPTSLASTHYYNDSDNELTHLRNLDCLFTQTWQEWNWLYSFAKCSSTLGLM